MSTKETITEIEKPKRKDDIHLLKQLGCFESKQNHCRMLFIPKKIKCIKTSTIKDGICPIISIQYDLFKNQKLICSIQKCEDGYSSFEKVIFM